ncbi:Uncharacterised protein [Shigella flexneri]|nr:Uncharacterised protein [Shigella flexneri]
MVEEKSAATTTSLPKSGVSSMAIPSMVSFGQ